MMLLIAAIATASAAGPMDLSYQSALEAALNANPALVGARLEVEAADGAMLAAKGVFDPMINASTSANQFTSESTREFGEVLSEFKSFNWKMGVNQFVATGTNLGLEWSTSSTRFKYELRDSGFVVETDRPLYESRMMATFSQSLLDGFKLASNLESVHQAIATHDSAKANRRAIRQQTLADTASAYWNTRTMASLAQIAAQGVAQSKEEQRIVYAKVALGTLAPVETARVDALVIQARQELLTATDTAQNTEDSLLLLMGIKPGTPIRLTTEAAQPVEMTLNLEKIEEIAIKNNAELAVARINEESTEIARLNARHRRLPQLDFNASYALIGYEPNRGNAAKELMSGDLPEWSVGGTFAMPLLGRADRGQYLQKSALRARAHTDLVNLERSIRSQVRTGARTVEGAALQVSLAKANLDLAEATLVADRALAEVGRVIQKDLLESIRTVDDARTQVEQAKGDYQLALIELERLKGTL
jgi:outer membrane protein